MNRTSRPSDGTRFRPINTRFCASQILPACHPFAPSSAKSTESIVRSLLRSTGSRALHTYGNDVTHILPSPRGHCIAWSVYPGFLRKWIRRLGTSSIQPPNMRRKRQGSRKHRELDSAGLAFPTEPISSTGGMLSARHIGIKSRLCAIDGIGVTWIGLEGSTLFDEP
jgi:hypothetical protein